MRMLILVLCLFTLVGGVADAREYYPQGRETFYIAPFGFELDPDRDVINTVQDSWRIAGYIQGYDKEVYNGFGLDPNISTIPVDALLAVFQTKHHLVQHDAHGNTDWVTFFAWTHDDYGKTTRNNLFNSLKEWPYKYRDGVHMIKTEKDTSDVTYYGISVCAEFFRKQVDDIPMRLPDVWSFTSCSTACQGWRDLINEDLGLEVLVLQHVSNIYSVERKAAWERLAGRSGYDYEDHSPWALRTVANAWSLPCKYYGDYYFRRPISGNGPFDPVYDINIRLPVFYDSLALAPWVTGHNIEEWTELPTYSTSECYDNHEFWIEFSGEMHSANPEYWLTGYWGCWVGCERWTTGCTSDTTRVEFRAASVANTGGYVRAYAAYDGYPGLCSKVGRHPFYIYDLWGPADPVTMWESPMLCLHDAPNYAAAYGPTSAWIEHNQTIVNLNCTEVESESHLVLAGDHPGNLSVVETIPGNGGRHIVRNELVTLPGMYDYVQFQEIPSGALSNLTPVRMSKPEQLEGWEFRTPEFHPSPLVDSHSWSLPPSCPDFVFYCGLPEFEDIIRNETNFEQILADNYLPDVEYVVAPGIEGEYVRGYLAACFEAYNRCPWLCIVGSGNEEPDYSKNIVSPHMEPDCPTCFFRPFQIGDAQWGELDDDYMESGWMPEGILTRINCSTADQLRRYAAGAWEFHQQSVTHSGTQQVLAILGDESEGGIDPEWANNYWTDVIRPAFTEGMNYVVDEIRASEFEYYYEAQPLIADRFNSQAEHPSIVYLFGVWASMFRSPGALWYAWDGFDPWDGSLLEPSENHYILVSPICGLANNFRYSAWDPALGFMGMEQYGNDQFPSVNTAACVALMGNTSGGTENQHRRWARLDAYYAPRSLTTMHCHEARLRAYAAIYPEDYHYCQGQMHWGLPMRYMRDASSVDEVISPGCLGVLRCQSIFNNHLSMKYSLPPLPCDARAEILIFDPNGRLVDRLSIDNEQNEGLLVWHPTESHSGVYFANLVVNNTSFAKSKAILVR